MACFVTSKCAEAAHGQLSGKSLGGMKSHGLEQVFMNGKGGSLNHMYYPLLIHNKRLLL